MGLIPVSSGWPSRLAARTSASPSLFPSLPTSHSPFQAAGSSQLIEGLRWVEAAGCSQDLSHCSQLHGWDEARAPERWGRRAPLPQQPGTWGNFVRLESSRSQQKRVISVQVYFRLWTCFKKRDHYGYLRASGLRVPRFRSFAFKNWERVRIFTFLCLSLNSFDHIVWFSYLKM